MNQTRACFRKSIKRDFTRVHPLSLVSLDLFNYFFFDVAYIMQHTKRVEGEPIVPVLSRGGQQLPADLSRPDVTYVDIEVRFSATAKHSSELSLEGFATIISSRDLVLDLELHLLRL